MRLKALVWTAILASTATAVGQAASTRFAHPQGDVAVTWNWVRTNAQPGGCGCFYLNGGGVSGSLKVTPRWSAVLEAGVEHNGSVPGVGTALTLDSLHLGARYALPQPWKNNNHAPLPFAQILAGATRAEGAEAGVANGENRISALLGGGADFPVRKHIALRAQVDYYLTSFENTVNARQNNLRVVSGAVWRW
jgi:outer membrane immunogenic protein